MEKATSWALSYQKYLCAALSQNMPVVLWRLPHQSAFHLMVDFSGQASVVEHWYEMPTGFLFAPFEQAEKKYIFADWHYYSDTEQVEESFRSQSFGSIYAQNKEAFLKQLNENKQKWTFPKGEHQTTPQLVFEKNVEKAILAIQAQSFQKVVLSKTQTIDFQDLDLAKAFHSLCQAYPHAFVCMLYEPQEGLWLGASPEILLSQDKKGIFRTVALAGTQAKGTQNIRQASWSQKEIEEQALVSRYIINCFKKIRLREFEESGPKTVEAGNLLHLRTDFEVDTNAVNFAELPQVMLELLHPTSAVCGMPKASAYQFILDTEAHSRRLYSGYWGAVNLDGEHHLFVNLRCMQIFDQKAILYAGCGITADSCPTQEWEETQIKCQTLANVLFKKNVNSA